MATKTTPSTAQAAQRDLVEQALANEAIARAMEAYKRAAMFAPRPLTDVAPKVAVSAGANS